MKNEGESVEKSCSRESVQLRRGGDASNSKKKEKMTEMRVIVIGR